MTTDPLLSAREAQAVLGCSRWFLTEHAAELGAVKVGNRLKFTHAGISAYIARQTVKAPEPIPMTKPAPEQRFALARRGPINPVTRLPWGMTQEEAASRAAGRGRSTDKKTAHLSR